MKNVDTGRPRYSVRMLLVTLLVSALFGSARAATVEISSEALVDGPMASRLAKEPADLVVLYGGEHKGSLETCGCPHRPRGSLARAETVRAATRDPYVLVNAGYFLEDPTGFDGAVRADIVESNRWMAQGLGAGRWDALNVGTPDVAALASLDAASRDGLPLVSANLVGPGIEPWVIVERGGRKIGITGVSGEDMTLGGVGAYHLANTRQAVDVVARLAAQVDVVILLAWHAEDLAATLARKADVDVIVDANLHREQGVPRLVGGAWRVDSYFETMRLGELRLRLEGGAITGGVDRQIDLDPSLGDDPGMLALQHEARTAIDVIQAGPGR